VGVLSENRPEWCIVYLSAVISGLVIVPIDAQLDEAESTSIIERSRIKVLCALGRFMERVSHYCSSCRALRHFVSFDEEAEKSKGVLGFTSLLRREYDSELPEASEISGDDTASLIVTPGGKNVYPEEVDGVNKQLPGYKRIKNNIIREDEFEKTSSRKIKRFLYQGYIKAGPGLLYSRT
jgi:hypothetical protein